jgi:DNA gyrase/topoisomerase IV subunit B
LKSQEFVPEATSAEYIRLHRETQKENEDIESQSQTLLLLGACKDPESMLRSKASIFVVEGGHLE